MVVFLWFYINFNNFDFIKNWFWCGDEFWDICWVQVMEVNFDFVEIFIWNDYGEFYYIGFICEKEFGLFDMFVLIFYVENMSYDGWCKFLFFYIE